MSFDVFISYAHEDQHAAFTVCRALEDAGIPCWIAPRDVPPGQDFAVVIIEAIERCRMMVLIFSQHVNESPHVRSEVGNAFDSRMPIIPLRIADVQPASAMKHLLASSQWFDAFPMRQAALDELVAAVAGLLGKIVIPRPKKKHLAPWIALAAALLLGAVIGGVILFNRLHSTPPSGRPGIRLSVETKTVNHGFGLHDELKKRTNISP